MLFAHLFLLASGVSAAVLSQTPVSHPQVNSTGTTSTATATCSSANFAGIDPHAPFTEVPDFGFDQLWDLSTRFLDAFMYPKNSIEAAKINSTLFAENVKGRVDATRDFLGRELNTEYAFGLFSNIALNPSSFTLLGIPESYYITHLTANENIASFAAIVDFNITAVGLVNPVEIDLTMTFNSLGEISQYDATFRYLDWQFAALSDHAKKLFKFNSTAEVMKLSTNLLANSICNTAQDHCKGSNQQYSSKDECVDFLTNDIPFGSAWQLGMNTLACRMVHQGMVPIRPDVHCMHIGRTGGGYCTNDRTYAGTVREKLFTNSPFVPYGKQTKGPKGEE